MSTQLPPMHGQKAKLKTNSINQIFMKKNTRQIVIIKSGKVIQRDLKKNQKLSSKKNWNSD